jgi:DNA-binding XRE family transcriptional regulator
MSDHLSNERKQELCRLMASNLPTLRTKANISQGELADRLGFSRQTISAVENGKREMQWNVFSAVVPLFSKNIEIYQLMVVMGIINDDVEKILSLPSKENDSLHETDGDWI